MVSIASIVGQGAVLGLVATLAMDLVMAKLEEGTTAPRVSASVLTGVDPDAVTERRANLVHYAAGLASGVLFLLLLDISWSLLGVESTTLGPGSLLGVGASGVLLFAWLVGFFGFVVLPRYDAGLSRQRLGRIRRDWAIAAATHVTALAVLWFALTTLV